MRLRALRACAWPWTMALRRGGVVADSAGGGTGSERFSGGRVGAALDHDRAGRRRSAGGNAATARAATTHHRVTSPPATHRAPAAKRPLAAPVKSVAAEPAQARLLLKEDTWIYAQPSNRSAQIEQGEKGKFVMVTGTTHYFLRVKLKNGQEGYVPADGGRRSHASRQTLHADA